MADTDLSIDDELVEEPEEPGDAELEDEGWNELESDLDENLEEGFDDDEEEDIGDEADEGGESSEEAGEEEALDELEAEELEMLTDDEASETLIVDEQQELRAIRRAEIALEDDSGGERAEDEFLCQSCFLVLSTSQLADKRRKLCVDCAG